MLIQRRTKIIREGNFVADVEVESIEASDGRGPYLSQQDAQKLDDVRLSLRRGDLSAASKLARVYRLTPID